ncbi:hypothetical protein DFH06DRAFT_1146988 [Mycena polygramma]|nr:hypothetical protein DFH06DRAFT_1146988 [Mycena polygramma]
MRTSVQVAFFDLGKYERGRARTAMRTVLRLHMSASQRCDNGRWRHSHGAYERALNSQTRRIAGAEEGSEEGKFTGGGMKCLKPCHKKLNSTGTSRPRFWSFMLQFRATVRYRSEVHPTTADIRLDGGSHRQVMHSKVQCDNIQCVLSRPVVQSNHEDCPGSCLQTLPRILAQTNALETARDLVGSLGISAAPWGVGFHGYLARLLPLETLEIGLQPSNNSIQAVFQIAAQEAGI